MAKTKNLAKSHAATEILPFYKLRLKVKNSTSSLLATADQISEIPPSPPLTSYKQHNITPFRLKISTIIGNCISNSIKLYHVLPVVQTSACIPS